MVSAIVTNINTYALMIVGTRWYIIAYVHWDEFWTKTTSKEIEEYMALVMYFGLVKVSGHSNKY